MKITLLTRPAARRWLGFALLGLLATDATLVTAAPWRARQATARTLVRNYTTEFLATDPLRPNERAFLDRAAENSRQTLRLAQLAMSQANSAELRTFAQQLVADHRQLSEAIVSLVRKKGAPAEVPTGQSDQFQQLAEKSGSDFDQEFLKLLAPLQDTTLTLFEEASGEVKDPDVRDFAASYLPTLRDHTNTIVGLRKTLE